MQKGHVLFRLNDPQRAVDLLQISDRVDEQQDLVLRNSKSIPHRFQGQQDICKRMAAIRPELLHGKERDPGCQPGVLHILEKEYFPGAARYSF